MPQVHAAASDAFVRRMQRDIANLKHVHTYLDYAIAHDTIPSSHVDSVREFG